jgi:hypothetical protein
MCLYAVRVLSSHHGGCLQMLHLLRDALHRETQLRDLSIEWCLQCHTVRTCTVRTRMHTG